MSVIKFTWIGVSCCIRDSTKLFIKHLMISIVLLQSGFYALYLLYTWALLVIRVMILEKHCVTIDKLLHWTLDWSDLHITHVYFLWNRCLYMCVSSAYLIVLKFTKNEPSVVVLYNSKDCSIEIPRRSMPRAKLMPRFQYNVQFFYYVRQHAMTYT